MTLEVSNSAEIGGSKNWLFYGASGAGKTRLSATAPNPLFLMFEGQSKLQSTKDLKVDFVAPETWPEIMQITQQLIGGASAKDKTVTYKNKVYQAVIGDSLTEMNLIIHKSILQAGRREAAQIQDWMLSGDRTETILRQLLSLPCVVIITALEQLEKDEVSGGIVGAPFLPGKLPRKIPALFDEVFHLRTEQSRNDKGELVPKRFALTSPDHRYFARDGSGKLAGLEEITLNGDWERLWRKMGNSSL